MNNGGSNVSRLLSRRRMLALIAGGGATILGSGLRRAAAAHYDGSLACTVRPAQIEGPFFVDAKLKRSDIRSDPDTGVVKPGALLRLTFRITRIDGDSCLPLPGALVDVWHCDAQGLYSDAGRWQASTLGQQFLRGYQVTDRKGVATFTTIFPGRYPNRAVHIHFKIRSTLKTASSREFTSQIYFPDELTETIHAHPAYPTRGPRKVRNDRDVIFLFRGSQLILPLREDKRGYAGTFDVALDIG